MKAVADHLRQTLQEALHALRAISDDEASIKSQPERWSKKEIIGHLIDSASNNQQKFVRTMEERHVDFVAYNQDFWVTKQQYNNRSWDELITFWHAYNLHIAHIIESVNEASLENTVSIERSKPFSLAFIIEDYVEHLKHHLKAILK